jgi:hypothetical protein
MSRKPFLELYEKELIRQGREKLDSGGWSEQDSETCNVHWPTGVLTPDWAPCSYDGKECIPYQDDVAVSMKIFDNETDELTDFGKWAPMKYVYDVVAGGFSMAVWCPGDGQVILYGMCSNCGMVINRSAVATDDGFEDLRWCPSSAEGAEWVYFPG